MTALFIYIACANQEEARTIAQSVVEQRLAACANILQPHEAIYWWEGDVQSGQEVGVIFKTRGDLFDKLGAAVKNLHSYDVPCIVALPIEKGYAPFLKWIEDETEL